MTDKPRLTCKVYRHGLPLMVTGDKPAKGTSKGSESPDGARVPYIQRDGTQDSGVASPKPVRMEHARPAPTVDSESPEPGHPTGHSERPEPGRPIGQFEDELSYLRAEIIRLKLAHGVRVTELLEANNREVERRRVAELQISRVEREAEDAEDERQFVEFHK